MIYFLLPESRSTEEREILQEEGAAQGGMPAKAYAIFFANFLNGVGFTAFEALGELFIQDSFFDGDINPATKFFGYVITGVGVVGLIVNLFIYNRIVPYTGLKGAIAFGGVFSVSAFAAIGVPINKVWFFVW